MELSWYLFSVAAGFAIVITLITVSYHAVSAAITNPVKSLTLRMSLRPRREPSQRAVIPGQMTL